MQMEDNKKYLEEALSDIENMEKLKAEKNELMISENKLIGLIDAKKKELAHKIETTTKSRLSEVENLYAKELKTLHNNQTTIKNRRDKAKNQGVKERILLETEGVKAEIREIKSRIKEMVKRERIPCICKHKCFYSIFMPNRFMDFIKLIILFIICFAVIPIACYKFIPLNIAIINSRPIIKLVLFYLVDILFFGFIYIFISDITKSKHKDKLKEIRGLFNEIRLKKEIIRQVTKNIKNDGDENRYNLSNYDEELESIQNSINSVTEKRKEALSTFDNVTKGIIIEELNEAASSEIKAYEEELSQVKKNLSIKDEDLRKISMSVSEKYETKLGREFLNKQKIEKLITILGEDETLSLIQAMEKAK